MSGGGGSGAFIVASFVAAEGLPGGENLVADGALVQSSGGGGGGGDAVLVLVGGPAVAGLVAPKCLVRGKRLVAHAAPVTLTLTPRHRLMTQLVIVIGSDRFWLWLWLWLWLGAAAVGEHDEMVVAVFTLVIPL